MAKFSYSTFSLNFLIFFSEGSPTNSPKESLPNDIIQYTVKPTDTLLGIAIQFNMKPEAVRQYNGLHTNQVVPGQVEKIRGNFAENRCCL